MTSVCLLLMTKRFAVSIVHHIALMLNTCNLIAFSCHHAFVHPLKYPPAKLKIFYLIPSTLQSRERLRERLLYRPEIVCLSFECPPQDSISSSPFILPPNPFPSLRRARAFPSFPPIFTIPLPIPLERRFASLTLHQTSLVSGI